MDNVCKYYIGGIEDIGLGMIFPRQQDEFPVVGGLFALKGCLLQQYGV